VLVATTDTATQTEAQQKSSWSPWKVLSPFGNKQKRQQPEQQQLHTISEAELWNMLEAEQEGKLPLIITEDNTGIWFLAHTCVLLPSAACVDRSLAP
jgi:hypothetical protein